MDPEEGAIVLFTPDGTGPGRDSGAPQCLWQCDMLDRIPAFARGGSILTLGNVRQCTAEPLTELTLEVYPDAGATGRWTLIEDDGEAHRIKPLRD